MNNTSKLILILCFFSVNFSAFPSSQSLDHRSGEVIVKLKSGSIRSFLSKKSQYGLKVKKLLNLSFGNFAVFKSQNKDLDQVLKKLNQDPAVDYAEVNYIYKLVSYKPKDPMFVDLWGLSNNGKNEPRFSGVDSRPKGIAGVDINALEAWKLTKGKKGIKIAVIDTGVDYNHSDLRRNIWTNDRELNGKPGVDDDGNGYIDDIHGYDFANSDGDPMDGNGHGTHCAGTIAAEHNKIGISGVMANVDIVAIKFLTDAGAGDTAAAIQAIDYATKLNVDVMNNSWGGPGKSEALKEAIQRASEAGIIFIAAAGNSESDNNSTQHYPSNYKVNNVIGVAAYNYNDELASFSSYGSKTVHVVGPGKNILSTIPNNSYSVLSGTSMASPHIAGVVGLYISYHGRLPVLDIRDRLIKSSIYSKAYSKKIIARGRVDAFSFLKNEIQPRPSEPKPSDWIALNVDYESLHPYGDLTEAFRDFTVAGALFLRVVFEKIDVERNWDFVIVKDKDKKTIDKITGKHNNYISDYVDGETLSVGIKSDASVNHWGFKVKEIQYIK